MAAGYAALGDARLEEDKLEAARDAYQRALRLAIRKQATPNSCAASSRSPRPSWR